MGRNELSVMAATDLRRSCNISASMDSIEDGFIEWRYEGTVEFLCDLEDEVVLLKNRIKEKRRFFLLLLELSELLELADMAGEAGQ